jgi:hypothetical protein
MGELDATCTAPIPGWEVRGDGVFPRFVAVQVECESKL